MIYSYITCYMNPVKFTSLVVKTCLIILIFFSESADILLRLLRVCWETINWEFTEFFYVCLLANASLLHGSKKEALRKVPEFLCQIWSSLTASESIIFLLHQAKVIQPTEWRDLFYLTHTWTKLMMYAHNNNAWWGSAQWFYVEGTNNSNQHFFISK